MGSIELGGGRRAAPRAGESEDNSLQNALVSLRLSLATSKHGNLQKAMTNVLSLPSKS